MREDEAKREIGQRHAVIGRELFQLLHARQGGSERLLREVDVSKISFRPPRLHRQRAGQTAFIERYSRDDGDAEPLTRGKEFVLGDWSKML